MSARPPTHLATAAALGRTPPHSLEAEEYLLSCCLLDGSETIARCLDARLQGTAFYSSAHRIIYEKMVELYRLRPPVDIAMLAEELKTAKLLDAVGGYSYLAQVSTRIPTTAQAGYFIEKVRELHQLRELIKVATGAVEKAWDCQGDVGELLGAVRDELTLVAEGGRSTRLAAMLDAARFDPANPPPRHPPIYLLGTAPILTPGNVLALAGPPKGGKTGVVTAMLAAPIGDGDTLGIESSNASGLAVVHFDTEQAPADHHTIVTTALRRVGAAAPAWLRSYSLLGVALSERFGAIEFELGRARAAHRGVHSVIIDGVADLIADPNDPAESFAAVERLHRLAAEFDTGIVCILHVNPGSEIGKTRGHLGSQLERKAETNLRLEKDTDGVTTAWVERGRHCHVPKSEGPRFQWCAEAGMHTSCQTAAASRDDAKRERLRDQAEAVFIAAGTHALAWSAMRDGIAKSEGIGTSGAGKRFDAMKAFGVIKKDSIGLWRLA